MMEFESKIKLLIEERQSKIKTNECYIREMQVANDQLVGEIRGIDIAIHIIEQAEANKPKVESV